MSNNIYSFLLLRSLYQPALAFDQLSKAEPAPFGILLRYTIWLLILPPAFSFIGAANFGWQLGAPEPLRLATDALMLVSLGYVLVLIFGLVSTVIISRWMAATYGASTALGRHIALITIVGEPLAIGSMAHLYPNVFFNILVLIPTTIWSMYLLYTGIPVVLEIPPERGMLMASALVGWLLVAVVSLLGLSMIMWTMGVGPLLGV
jgi:hypothetical protein